MVEQCFINDESSINECFTAWSANKAYNDEVFVEGRKEDVFAFF